MSWTPAAGSPVFESTALQAAAAAAVGLDVHSVAGSPWFVFVSAETMAAAGTMLMLYRFVAGALSYTWASLECETVVDEMDYYCYCYLYVHY